MSIKPIAIHLPQYHPFDENDEWWGKGFTEWTNVTKAKPWFKGHYQPHLPADLGFYDLRLEESRIAQAALAQQYGIYGFCYYHYWFKGKRLMERPLDDMLKTQTPDFPFMLCWANETWSRRWNGSELDFLIKQEHSLTDDIAHIQFLMDKFFIDKRYIKVNDKPFFLIYRPNLFPNIKETIGVWRKEAAKEGMELYIGYMKSSAFDPPDFENYGFDCGVEFQPEFKHAPIQKFPTIIEKVKNKLGIEKTVYYENYITSYQEYVEMQMKRPPHKKGNVYPGVTPGWDNSARKAKNALILTDSSPEMYGKWLEHVAKEYKNEDTFIFINAWNEWAEGNHLEPCLKWGKKYLEETKHVLDNI